MHMVSSAGSTCSLAHDLGAALGGAHPRGAAPHAPGNSRPRRYALDVIGGGADALGGGAGALPSLLPKLPRGREGRGPMRRRHGNRRAEDLSDAEIVTLAQTARPPVAARRPRRPAGERAGAACSTGCSPGVRSCATGPAALRSPPRRRGNLARFHLQRRFAAARARVVPDRVLWPARGGKYSGFARIEDGHHRDTSTKAIPAPRSPGVAFSASASAT